MTPMNCTTEKCPHRALLEKARKACLSCDHVLPAGHGGTISYEAAGENVVYGMVEPTHGSGGARAMALPEAVEERLRMLLHTVTGLDTLDALLLFHVANGGTCGTFGAYLLRIVEAVRSFNPGRDGFRATAHIRWQRLKDRFAPFAALQSWKPVGSGAKVAPNRMPRKGASETPQAASGGKA